jgi:hypothetical protein
MQAVLLGRLQLITLSISQDTHERYGNRHVGNTAETSRNLGKGHEFQTLAGCQDSNITGAALTAVAGDDHSRFNGIHVQELADEPSRSNQGYDRADDDHEVRRIREYGNDVLPRGHGNADAQEQGRREQDVAVHAADTAHDQAGNVHVQEIARFHECRFDLNDLLFRSVPFVKSLI